jgi:transposase
MHIHDQLGTLFSEQDLAHLYPAVGQPAESPRRLLWVTLFQFMEGLSDRQAADAVRRCLDWKYALALELTDPGFDHSVLSEFRDRLLAADAGIGLLNQLLARCRTAGLLKTRGQQRTDATHVLAAVRSLNRLECLGETLAHTLQQLLWDAPAWAQATIPADWWDRYGARFDQFRLPSTAPKREALALAIGADGHQLLQWTAADATPADVRAHPAVALLRQVWRQQFATAETPLHLHQGQDLPPAAQLIGSPYDPDARQSTKRTTTWNGYKVHLTESCDPDDPHLITDVQTTPATTADAVVLPQIQQALAARDLLPAEQFVDQGYTGADALVASQAQGIDLVGPVPPDTSWQTQADQGFGIACFAIDWAAERVTCPQGQVSRVWSPSQDTAGHPVIHVQFDQAQCGACGARAHCTRARSGPRTLKLHPHPQHTALQAARARQATTAFKGRYQRRAGVEGTISQGTQGFDLRYARYRGLAKTALQHCLVALAINLTRLVAWWEGRPHAQTRSSRFTAAFAHAARMQTAAT